MTDVPAYLRIAAELRRQILSGELPEGAKIPSEAKLRQDYGASITTAKQVVNLLKAERLVEGRFGSGVYVRAVKRVTRRSFARNARTAGDSSTSPFARDAQAAGYEGSWESNSEPMSADAEIAKRLGIAAGDPVMRTSYRFLADGEPIQLSTSWEPLAITGGTSVELPEDGAATGVVARMDLIGIHVDEFVERVTGRSALPDELERLGLPPAATVLAVERTYLADGRAVETADIVFAGDRYRLEYRAPVE